MIGPQLSPIALAVRGQALGALTPGGVDLVAEAGREILDLYAGGFDAGDDRLAECAAAIIEGVLSAMVEMRSEMITAACHALVGSTLSRPGMNPASVAETVAALSRVLEREPTTTTQDFEAAIDGALTACEEMGRSDRETVVAAMRQALAAAAMTS